MLGDVAGGQALTLAREAPHASRDVRRESRARLLAVVADIDPGLELLLHDVPNRVLGRALQLALVDRVPAVLAHEQVAQGRIARNAADVRDEDPVLAPAHASAGC